MKLLGRFQLLDCWEQCLECAGRDGAVGVLLFIYLFTYFSALPADRKNELIVSQTISIENFPALLVFAFSQEENAILKPLYWC